MKFINERLILRIRFFEENLSFFKMYETRYNIGGPLG